MQANCFCWHTAQNFSNPSGEKLAQMYLPHLQLFHLCDQCPVKGDLCDQDDDHEAVTTKLQVWFEVTTMVDHGLPTTCTPSHTLACSTTSTFLHCTHCTARCCKPLQHLALQKICSGKTLVRAQCAVCSGYFSCVPSSIRASGAQLAELQGEAGHRFTAPPPIISSAIQCNAVHFSAAHLSALQCNSVQCNQCIEMHCSIHILHSRCILSYCTMHYHISKACNQCTQCTAAHISRCNEFQMHFVQQSLILKCTIHFSMHWSQLIVSEILLIHVSLILQQVKAQLHWNAIQCFAQGEHCNNCIVGNREKKWKKFSICGFVLHVENISAQQDREKCPRKDSSWWETMSSSKIEKGLSRQSSLSGSHKSCIIQNDVGGKIKGNPSTVSSFG